ncbi:DUF262 domain-containing protein [Vibrio cholerae]|uniref:Orf10 n=9 Tax=root TaxID=1 RepID=Q8W758_9CAUD|nr:DUF262 domain-containing protein [Vibrio cholerae]NP_536642.1 DUF262 domain-containing protein [Bacteriophage K139]YP_001650881.1 DUF262 domain-containing protein [Vibrio phage Kappa]YP_008766831.1 DUF262 domain-containing protein [Vibrio phage VPUSM 8]AAN74010.1 ORF10 [Vibrio phage O395]ANA87648.1 hypothetical protein VcP032_16 [Vibrio phage VcP032]EAZ75246.1 hypothetical protein A5C_A0257 [Vibrio cholerae NCTC 8457]PWN69533.1 DUF262 domain-containing protein [Bacillus cereus]HAS4638153
MKKVKSPEDMPYRLPKPVIFFNSTSTTISSLVSSSGYGKEAYPWAERMLGRFPLPKWQRQLVWSDAQKLSFIESVFMGYDLGSVMINSYEDLGNGLTRPMSDILIDGQQRISALLAFINNEFEYEGYFWKNLNRREQRRFLEREMGKRTTECYDENELKKVYNHLNFSGVRHEISEMA